MVLAPLRVRLMSLFYEGVLLFSLVFIASYLFISLARDAQSGLPRLVFQLYLLAICGAYFLFCWVRSGQTLPMKTWRMRLVMRDGGPLRAPAALLRYLLAIPAMATGVGIVWAFFDRDRQFLHDRLAGTRIVRVPQVRGAGPEASGSESSPA
jgi:uncharacterized RDD family membrane protein YckC